MPEYYQNITKHIQRLNKQEINQYDIHHGRYTYTNNIGTYKRIYLKVQSDTESYVANLNRYVLNIDVTYRILGI